MREVSVNPKKRIMVIRLTLYAGNKNGIKLTVGSGFPPCQP